MDEASLRPAIRMVIAAPFPEIVTLHERAGEYADEIDVCGAVIDAAGVVDQVRVLQPEVLLFSDRLAAVADVAARLAAVAPTTRLVLLRSGSDRDGSPGLADGVIDADASADELRQAILAAAGRHLPEVAPAAHAREGAPTAAAATDAPSWFWESPAPEPAADPVPQPTATEHPGRRWPPPWFRVAAASPEPPAAETPADDPKADAPGADPAAAHAEVAPELAAPAEPITAEETTVVASPAWGTRATAREEPAGAAPTAAATGEEPSTEPDATASPPETPPTPAPAEAPPAAEPEPAGEQAAITPAAETPGPAATPEAEPEPEPIPAQPPRRTRRPGRARAETVLVFSGKGGVGKSVIATNLAVALSKRGAAVVVVDLNLQYGDVGVLLHLESHPTSIESLAQQGEQIEREFLDEVLAPGPEEVRALLAPTSPEFADLVTAASLRAILRELGRNFDYIIVDSASHLEELVLEVMEIADQILMVTTFNITAVKDTKITLKLLQSLGIERERIAVILNQTRAKINFPRSDIEKSLRFAMLAHLPYESRVDDTIDTGKPMVLTDPRSEFAKQVNLVVDYLAPDEGAPGVDRQKNAKRRFGFGR